MKMRRASNGEYLQGICLDFCIPNQESVDAGQLPFFSLDVLGLLSGEEQEALQDAEDYVFELDAFPVLSATISDAEEAEVFAGWLEFFAMQIREKFSEP